MSLASNNINENDPLIPSGYSSNAENINATERHYSGIEPRSPIKLYSVLFWLWSLLFWVLMMFGALHGLLIKGPIELYKRREEWTIDGYLEWWAWVVLALIIIFFAYCEGYRGFQRAFSPMLVTRSYHFSSVTSPVYEWSTVIYIDRFTDFILAPLLSAGFICGTRRRIAVSWGVAICVVALIVGVTYMSEDTPWKCFIDVGVVIGLGWGEVFILVWWFKIFFLNKWPDWIPNEYPEKFCVRQPENILVKTTTTITSSV